MKEGFSCKWKQQPVTGVILLLVVLFLAPFGDAEPTGATANRNKENLRRHLEDAYSGDEPMVVGTMDEEVDGTSAPFTPAQSIEFFRDGIDPSIFEWVNKKEVQPGNTTCGFLHSPLVPFIDADSEDVYPIVEVYICMRFARIQPAPKGNLFVHCGGPSSTTDCVTFMGDTYMLGDNNTMNYNSIAIDQRGMGRSSPSFAHVECTIGLTRNETGGLDEVSQIAKTRENLAVNVDPANDESIRNYTTALKERVFRCWTCETCGFQLTATQPDGTNKTWHFLEHSGTRALAVDINRFRQAVRAEKMSIYGISYGTQVMSTYATMFPGTVDKFVIDSNLPPSSNRKENAEGFAFGYNQRIDFLLYSCTAQNALDPKHPCPVDDMRVCIEDANKLVKTLSSTASDRSELLYQYIAGLYLAGPRAKDLCDAASEGDVSMITTILSETLPPEFLDSQKTKRQMDPEVDPSSKPTQPDTPLGNPEYGTIVAENYGDIRMWLVLAQDWAADSYDEETFIQQALEINKKYPGAGTGQPAQAYIYWYGMGLYWPKGVPLPPRGFPLLTGIVSGQLYDTATPYIHTQDMRENFKSTSLLTSQSIKHGMVDADYLSRDAPCQKHIMDYFETGQVGFVDGTICDADLAAIGNCLTIGIFGKLPDGTCPPSE